MNTKRITAHFWMWGIIAIGIIMAFLILPDRLIALSGGQELLSLAFIPLVIFLIFYAASIIYCYSRYSLKNSGFEKLVAAGVYGRRIHPTCTLVVIASWGIFIFFPDIRILVSDIWITLVVFFWIKLEEAVHMDKKNKKYTQTDSNPE